MKRRVIYFSHFLILGVRQFLVSSLESHQMGNSPSPYYLSTSLPIIAIDSNYEYVIFQAHII